MHYCRRIFCKKKNNVFVSCFEISDSFCFFLSRNTISVKCFNLAVHMLCKVMVPFFSRDGMSYFGANGIYPGVKVPALLNATTNSSLHITCLSFKCQGQTREHLIYFGVTCNHTVLGTYYYKK